MIDFFYNLNPAIQAFIGGLFTLLCTTIGASSVFIIKNKNNKNLLNIFLSLSAGVMLAASFFSLIIPAIEMSEKLKLIPIVVLIIGILGGTILLFLGDNFFKNKLKKAKDDKRISLLIFSIILHNIPEDCVYYVS